MSQRSIGSTSTAGPLGPVAASAAVLLMVASPLMRGGNRHVALIGLEFIALFILASLWLRGSLRWRELHDWGQGLIEKIALWVLLLSPVWLALVYLLPVPVAFWSGLPGRGDYGQLLADAGMPLAGRQPLSLVPDATKASLLTGAVLLAGFLAGYASRLQQLKLLLGVAAGMAFLQVLIGLLQAAGGAGSSLYFDVEFGGQPLGTFANTNHFANYIAMAAAGYVWLGWLHLVGEGSSWTGNPSARFSERHALAFWIAGAVVLVLGIVMSRSRGAALSGLPAALLATAVAMLSSGRPQSRRATLLVLAGVVFAAVALVGMGSFLSRFDVGRLATDASFRALLASSTLTGASAFWPWGAGWGTYASVYPRFQPVAINGHAEYAHQDYAQLLFEGGIFSVILMAAFLWLAIRRLIVLARAATGPAPMSAEQMASALCGIGLLGFLVHSLVEFNMHIPANATLAALLAGAFLRPLRVHETSQ